MNRYEVKFTRGSSAAVTSTIVTASSASQAKEKIKSQNNGNVKFVSVVER